MDCNIINQNEYGVFMLRSIMQMRRSQFQSICGEGNGIISSCKYTSDSSVIYQSIFIKGDIKSTMTVII